MSEKANSYPDNKQSERNLMERLKEIKCIDAPADFSTNFAAYGVDGLAENEIILLLIWRKLNSEQQQQVLEFIQNLNNST